MCNHPGRQQEQPAQVSKVLVRSVCATLFGDLSVHFVNKSLANLFGVLINNRLYLFADTSNLLRSDLIDLHAGFLHSILNNRPLLSRELVPGSFAQEHRLCIVDVPGQREILLDLLEFGVKDYRDGVLLSINHPLLKSRVDLWKGHRHAVRPKRVEQVYKQGRLNHAKLDAAEVLPSCNRALAVGHIAKSEFEVT